MMSRAVLILLVALYGLDARAPQITLYPRVVMQGSGVRLTCRVPRHEDNRVLLFGFTHWRSSTRQLDGLDARITWETIYDHIPCDPGEGFCAVQRADGGIHRATTTLTIGGCAP